MFNVNLMWSIHYSCLSDDQIPENCYGRSLSFDKLKDLVKTYFNQPSFKQEREGCASHPNSGAWETELLVNSPEFLLVVVNRIDTVMSEDGLRYITRREECEMPPSVTIPTSEGRQVYELFAVIEWDGVASPTSG